MRKLIVFVLFAFILISCKNDAYELRYEKYEDYAEITNPRLKGWFPNIINSDSYNLKSDSYLNICDFVKFNYSNNKNYDSLFLHSPKVPLLSFKEKIKTHEKLKPDWFPNSDEINLKDFEIIAANGFDLARRKYTKEIFGICHPDNFPIR